jgi:hypothetical protein
MSRVQKLLVCVVGAVVALVMSVDLGSIVMSSRQAFGGPAAPEVTATGWIKFATMLLGAGGFSIASIWQAVFAFIEAKGPGLLKRTAPTISDDTTADVVDLVKISTMLGLVRNSSDSDAKAKWTEAARLEFDALRDRLFPVEAK